MGQAVCDICSIPQNRSNTGRRLSRKSCRACPTDARLRCRDCHKTHLEIKHGYNGYVVLEVDSDTLRPVTGPILGWDLEEENALIEGLSNYDGMINTELKAFPWDGPEEPDGHDVWEYDQETGIVRSA